MMTMKPPISTYRIVQSQKSNALLAQSTQAMQSLRFKPNALMVALSSSRRSCMNLDRTWGVAAAPIQSPSRPPTSLMKNHASIIVKTVDHCLIFNGSYSYWGPNIILSTCLNTFRFFNATPPARNKDGKNFNDEMQESLLTSATLSTSASGNVNVRQSWDMMFEELEEYKLKHGDTLVPATYPPNPPLGNWVDNQRQTYRMRCEAECVAKEGFSTSSTDRFISDERIEKLNKIGFVWNLNDFLWNIKFEEFLLYIKEHGNTLVPHNHDKLGHWVVKQRRNYKVRMLREEKQSHTRKSGAELEINDSESGISDERIQKLNEVGFVWNVHEAQWLERFEELKKYREDHGDTLVPKSYSVYPFLGRWVDKQRLDYKRFIERKQTGKIDKNKPTGMTQQRIQLLEDVDFIWDPFQYAWDMKYNELCDFISINGHSAIRAKRGSKNFPLARWVSVQRSYYKKYLNGEKTSLTEERIEKLNRIGFVWENSRVDEIQMMVRSMRTRRTKLHSAPKQDV